MQQKYEHITKNIYFIQEKSVNIKKTVKCKLIREVLLIDALERAVLNLSTE